MERKQIIKLDYLDLLFEGRNKNYGAYRLRKTYARRLWKAVVGTVLFSFVGFWFLQSRSVNEMRPVLEKKEIVLARIEEVKTPLPPKAAPEVQTVKDPKMAITTLTTKPRVATANIKRTKFTTPIVKDQVSSGPVPTVDEIAVVDHITVDGVVANQIMAPAPPPPPAVGTEAQQSIATAPRKPKQEEQNMIFEKVEIQASVNEARWRQHLERHLVRYIEDAANSGMQPGTYTVLVRFLVEKDGSINGAVALNDPGFGLAQGAAQVVDSGPEWNPGEQNGRKVRSYHTQPITFVIMDS